MLQSFQNEKLFPENGLPKEENDDFLIFAADRKKR
jgi:hypothetical protein